VFWGNRAVHLIVPQQIVGRFDKQELQHAFDDDLLKDPPAIVQCRLGRRSLLAVILRRGQGRGDNRLTVAICRKVRKVYSNTNNEDLPFVS
jgi:hypothetical protein